MDEQDVLELLHRRLVGWTWDEEHHGHVLATTVGRDRYLEVRFPPDGRRFRIRVEEVGDGAVHRADVR